MPLVTSPTMSSPRITGYWARGMCRRSAMSSPRSRLGSPWSRCRISASRPWNSPLSKLDGPRQARLERGDGLEQILAVQRVSHLQTQHVAGGQPAGHPAERRRRLRELVPQGLGHVLVGEQLEADLARVSGAGEDDGAPAVLRLDALHEAEVRGLGEELGGRRAPTPGPGPRGSTSPGGRRGGADRRPARPPAPGAPAARSRRSARRSTAGRPGGTRSGPRSRRRPRSARGCTAPRPTAALDRSFVTTRCSIPSAPGPLTSTLPRCVRSNSPTRSRTARCSASAPSYSIGMSQPANGPIFAPSERCTASRGVARSSVPAPRTGSTRCILRSAAGTPRPCGQRRYHGAPGWAMPTT